MFEQLVTMYIVLLPYYLKIGNMNKNDISYIVK